MHTESDLLKEKGEGCPKVLFDRSIYSLYVLQSGSVIPARKVIQCINRLLL